MFNQREWTEISHPKVNRFSKGFTALGDGQKYFLKCPLEDISSQSQFSAESLFYQTVPPALGIMPRLGEMVFKGEVAQVFPYVEKDLVDFIGKFSPLTLKEKLLPPLLAAVRHIHTYGFVHGDLKLENIRIEERDNNFSIFVSDFGRAVQLNEFVPNRLGALSQHIPPDLSVGPQLDIYSIGVLTFQLLFGFDFIKKFQMAGRDFRLLPEAQAVDSQVLEFISRATEPSALKRFKSLQEAESFLTGQNHSQEYKIAPYDLAQNFEFYLECMRETFVASNRSSADFETFVGPWGEKYYQRLKKWTSSTDAHLVHMQKGEGLTGICESTVKEDGTALISTIFVIETERGKGSAQALERSAMHFFASHNRTEALLNVSPDNHRAIAFYRELGWQVTPHRQYPDAIQMRKKILNSATRPLN